jgi:hypothetical protein
MNAVKLFMTWFLGKAEIVTYLPTDQVLECLGSQ